MTNSDIVSTHGHRTRVRVCGVLQHNNELLLVKHSPWPPGGHLWIPPGGGVGFGESLEEAVTREVYEESGLKVQVEHLLFVSELIRPPLHAIEFFFAVSHPEIRPEPLVPEKAAELITQCTWLSWEALLSEAPECRHQSFALVNSLGEWINLRGLYHFR